VGATGIGGIGAGRIGGRIARQLTGAGRDACLSSSRFVPADRGRRGVARRRLARARRPVPPPERRLANGVALVAG
jgi:hypothetical protein